MTTIDEIGRRAAQSALEQAARSVDPQPGLDALRSGTRLVAPSYRRAPTTDQPRSRRWLIVASAAASIVTIVAITAVVRHDPSTGPGPVVTTPSTFPTPPPSSAPSSTIGAEGPTSSTASTLPDADPTGLAVSYLDPPPQFQPAPFATVNVPSCGPTADCTFVMPEMAVMEGAVVVVHPFGQAALIVNGRDGAVRTQLLAVLPSWPVAGPGNVLYGLVQGEAVQDYAITAIALDGIGAGQVVASEPVPAVKYIELPRGAFGHGPNGVVDRVRSVGAEIIQYVDAQGGPNFLANPAPFYAMVDDVISSTGSTTTWPLQIGRHPDRADLFVGESPPAPTSDGAAVVWTWIGPAEGDGDFALPSMAVVAWLQPDGSAVWRSLPAGWDVMASDIWGTLLGKANGAGDVQLAWLTAPDDQTTPPSGDPTTTTATTTATTTTTSSGGGLTLQRLGIGDGCVGGTCPSIRAAADGTLVAYTPQTRSITVLSESPQTIVVSALANLSPDDSYLEHVGPGDVAYISSAVGDGGESVGDLVAIALSGPRVGQEVSRAEASVDLSGDSDLVPTARGLVVVGCCGFDQRRPATDARLVMVWVDQLGIPSPDDGPELWVEFVNGSIVVTRRDGEVQRTWTVPDVSGFRGMPHAVATIDGGVMIFLQDTFDSTSRSRLATLHVDGSIEERSIEPYFPTVLEPTGTIIVFDNGYARVVV